MENEIETEIACPEYRPVNKASSRDQGFARRAIEYGDCDTAIIPGPHMDTMLEPTAEL